MPFTINDAIQAAVSIRTGLSAMAARIYADGGGNQGRWTARTKGVLCGVGLEQFGFDTRANGANFEYFPVAEENQGRHQGSEYLFDVCWQERNAEGWLLRTPMAAESEWGGTRDGVIFDFEKLLFARSALRVMVFEGPGETTLALLEELQARALLVTLGCDEDNLFQNDGIFLLAGLNWDARPASFIFRCFQVHGGGAITIELPVE